jgi:glutamate-1-semialdehyde aminotransferase
MTKNSGITLWNRAKKIIPGGSQLLSKRSEQFLPEHWPSYYSRAKGVDVWDLDNNHYIDMSSMGIGACTLGYADDDVNTAVINAIQNGSMCTLNCPEEVELAELLVRLHPWADMVRFARSGGEAVAIAIRIARAATRKDVIAFCGYHGWHDWYLASNLADESHLDGHLLPGLSPKGVPRGLKGTAIPFHFNHPEELEYIFSQDGEKIGAIIMEPIRHENPKPGFLECARKLADDFAIPLIFDEISSGWRMNVGGVHRTLNVDPDISVFAKAMSNGFPAAAIIGKEDYMDVAQESFISSTSWTERVGSAASIATIHKMEKHNVPDHLKSTGHYIGKEWGKIVGEYDLPVHVEGIPDIPPLVTMVFQHPEALAMQTFFTQEMLKRGYLAGKTVYVSNSHTKKIVDQYMQDLDAVFKNLNNALEHQNLKNLIDGPLVQTGFTRLT